MKKNLTLSENYTRSATEIVAELNEIITTGKEITAEKLIKLEADANAAAKYENNLATKAHIESMLSMEKVAMFTALIEKPFVPGIIKVTKNAKTAAYEIAEGKRQLGFFELEKAYQMKNSTENNQDGTPKANKSVTLAKDARYTVLLSLFTDNLARAIAKELETDCPQLNKAMAASRATEIDFTSATNTALVKQLNAIVAAILPQELETKMIACDVKALLQAATREKFMAFTMNKETAICNKIFMSIGFRRENKAYSFQSKAACHKADKVATSNK